MSDPTASLTSSKPSLCFKVLLKLQGKKKKFYPENRFSKAEKRKG